jgi:hypothetical protein
LILSDFELNPILGAPEAVGKGDSMTTLREYIGIMMDLDGYIAKGGLLLDLELFPEMPPGARKIFVDQMGADRLARLGRFWTCVGQLRGLEGNAMLGATCTEEEIRAVWRASADLDCGREPRSTAH